ncbi:TonB-dependent ferric enterobactin receptor CfrA [Helicobacter ibis]|uniref:TonB-dependent receptor n=1 Tax=Helicobacter ibis TaxID=2962633 RepID=A0ABT4VEX4_9HELI|nr:TonB-dependent receptor [Helicobacter ibis]MDA3969248.1 TonB-dependent receptor [Helicobacter ibis]
MSKFTKYTGILSIILPIISNANEEYRLDKSVVSASGFMQDVKEAPATISVITKEELSTKPYRDIAEAISDIPGVDLHASKGKTGSYLITMRGITGYTLILIDGRRQSVSGQIGPNGFSEAPSVFMPPLSSIERIEIIKGPMSTLYGSDALGGVINIITKKISNTWSASIQTEGIFNQDSKWGNYYGTSLYTSGPLINDKLGLTLRLREYYREGSSVEFRQQNGEILSPSVAGPQNPTRANLHNIGTKLTYTPNDNNTIILDFDYGLNKYNNNKSQIGTLTKPNSEGGLTGGYTDSMGFEKIVTYLTHEGAYDNFVINSGIQYNSVSNDGREVVGDKSVKYLGENRDILAQTYIADTKVTTLIGDKNMITLGGEYRLEKMQDKIANPTNFDQYSIAIFGEDEISITDKLNLTLGARYNYHETFGNNISPRAYVVYNPTDNLTLKGGISTGFKAPEPNLLIPGEYNYGGQGAVPIFGNPNLTEETSINYEASIYYNTDLFYIGATGYITDFKDKISSVSIQKDAIVPNTNRICTPFGGRTTCSQAINHGEVEYRGIELQAGISPFENLNFDFGYSYTDSNIKESLAKETIGTQVAYTLKHNINAKASYKILNFTPYIKAEWQGDRYRDPSEYESLGKTYKNIFLLSFGASYEINPNWTLNGGIYNLLNKDFTNEFIYDGSGYYNAYNRVEEGRRFWLSLTGTF